MAGESEGLAVSIKILSFLSYSDIGVGCGDSSSSLSDGNGELTSEINRNKINVNGKQKLFNIPLLKQSSNKKINEVEVNWQSNDFNKIIKTITQSYNKSPYLEDILNILEEIF